MCRILLLAVMLLSLLHAGCHRSPRLSFDSSQPHFHIHSKGAWGIDADYLVLPDDTFHYRSFVAKDGSIDKDGKTTVPGLFESLVKIADEKRAWSMTPASLTKEIAESGGGIGVYDAPHDYMSFRTSSRFFSVDHDHAIGFPSSTSHPQVDAFNALRRLLEEPRSSLLKSMAR